MRRSYDTDLTDEQWAEVRPYVESARGRRSSVDRREIVNAILYIARTGCQWHNLPHDLPNWSTVYSCYHRRAWNGVLDKLYTSLHKEVRTFHGKKQHLQPLSQIVRASKWYQKGALLFATTRL